MKTLSEMSKKRPVGALSGEPFSVRHMPKPALLMFGPAVLFGPPVGSGLVPGAAPVSGVWVAVGNGEWVAEGSGTSVTTGV